jgi:hypothetical protein
LSLLTFALVRTAALAYPILFLVGFTMILNNALANSTLQHLVPNAARALMAAYSFVVGLSQVVGSVRRQRSTRHRHVVGDRRGRSSCYSTHIRPSFAGLSSAV